MSLMIGGGSGYPMCILETIQAGERARIAQQPPRSLRSLCVLCAFKSF